MNIPLAFKKRIAMIFGREGERWLSALPSLVEQYAEKWRLQVGEPVEQLSYHYVVKVRDLEQRPLILKLGIPGEDVTREMHAVEVYGGERFAKLLAYDEADGVLLLERLEPGFMLSEIKEEEIAIHHFVEVWKAIRRPAEGMFPSIREWFAGLGEYMGGYPKGDGPVPYSLVKKAQHYAREIEETSAANELLHGDLHHYNILYDAGRGWCAIDPKGVVGDAYFDLVPFLFNELYDQDVLKQRVEMICRMLHLQEERLLKASIALLTLQTCWAAEDQGEWERMLRTIRWLESLLEGEGPA
ncbi:MAG: aminoglycoside phosphotransferase family protein [Lysinibacillus sp.]